MEINRTQINLAVVLRCNLIDADKIIELIGTEAKIIFIKRSVDKKLFIVEDASDDN